MAMTLPLWSCSTYWSGQKAHTLISQGKISDGLNILQGLAKKDPEDFRFDYIKERDIATQDLMQKAQMARAQGKPDEALAFYEEILRYDPQHNDATRGLMLIDRDNREAYQLDQAKEALKKEDQHTASRLLKEILAENPTQMEALALQQPIEIARNRELVTEPELNLALKRPVTLAFRDANLQAVFEILSQTSGINFIFDKDVKADLKTTIFARNTSVEGALNLILRTNKLNMKVLNDSTLLIYQDSDDKKKQYEDLVVRTFYLKSADPKKVQEMVRSLVAPKFMYVDDKLKMLTIRDNLNVINAAKNLIDSYDLADPEVVLEVEVLEINSDDLLNVGVQYPDQVRLGLLGASGQSGGGMTINQVRNLDRNNFQLFFPDPLAILNLKQTSSHTKTLATPRIRVSNHEKAKILIGDKVPVITTTVNQTSSASTESISYLDVGLKLEVEPEIHVDNDVSIAINLEVSNIAKEIKSTTGLLAYQIGTRNASTVLRLRNGETQVLAGLIKSSETDSGAHIPGLGKIPILGRLFSNDTNSKSHSEIVLLITPHIVRNLATPAAHIVEFASGTSDKASIAPLRLTPTAKYSRVDNHIASENSNQPTEVSSGSNSLNSAIPIPSSAASYQPMPSSVPLRRFSSSLPAPDPHALPPANPSQ